MKRVDRRNLPLALTFRALTNEQSVASYMYDQYLRSLSARTQERTELVSIFPVIRSCFPY